MKKTIEREYHKMRDAKAAMLVGRDAEYSLLAARAVIRFGELEAAGRVRIVAEAEQENYFDVFGKPDDEKEYKSLVETLDRMGCWWVHADVWNGCAECGRGEWETVDSVGMCVYDNPTSPYENCYVVDMMRAAIEKIEELDKE